MQNTADNPSVPAAPFVVMPNANAMETEGASSPTHTVYTDSPVASIHDGRLVPIGQVVNPTMSVEAKPSEEQALTTVEAPSTKAPKTARDASPGGRRLVQSHSLSPGNRRAHRG